MARTPEDRQARRWAKPDEPRTVTEILAAGLVRLIGACSRESGDPALNLPDISPAPLELPHLRALSVPVGEQTDGKAGAA